MSRKVYNPAALAALGKRWFAKPLPGFEVPIAFIREEVASFGAWMEKSDFSTMMENNLYKNLEEPHRTSFLTCTFTIQKWLRENGPTIFIEKEMLQACEKTDALSCVTADDVKIIYPVGFFSLPSSAGFVSKQTGDKIQHIWFAFLEQGDNTLKLNGKEIHIHADTPKLYMTGFWEKSEEVSSFCLPLTDSGIPLLEIIIKNRELITCDRVHRHTSEENLRLEMEDSGTWMCSIVINMMLLMQSYPQYIEKLSAEKSIRQNFRGEPPQSILIRRSTSRNPLQVVVEKDEEISSPTGRTVGNHWRRGHWRRQPHGDQFELENPEVQYLTFKDGRHYHMRWLRPIYIGLETEQLAHN